MIKFLLLSTLIAVAIGGYMLSQTMGDTGEGGVNVLNAQACTTQIEHGFRPVAKSMVGKQLQLQTLSFCMQAVSANGANNIDPALHPQVKQLNKQYYALEGALDRAPLTFMLDGETYHSLSASEQ